MAVFIPETNSVNLGRLATKHQRYTQTDRHTTHRINRTVAT